MTNIGDDKSRVDRETARIAHDYNLRQIESFNEASISAGHAAIKNLFLMHGGALIALLAFTSSTIGNDAAVYSPVQLAKPMIYFAFGLALATFASGAVYFTNISYTGAALERHAVWEYPFHKATKASKRWEFIGKALHILTIIAALASLASFVIGFWVVRSVFLGFS